MNESQSDLSYNFTFARVRSLTVSTLCRVRGQQILILPLGTARFAAPQLLACSSQAMKCLFWPTEKVQPRTSCFRKHGTGTALTSSWAGSLQSCACKGTYLALGFLLGKSWSHPLPGCLSNSIISNPWPFQVFPGNFSKRPWPSRRALVLLCISHALKA